MEFDVRLEKVKGSVVTYCPILSQGARLQVTNKQGVGYLREALLRVTNSGDFQQCGIDWAVLEVTHRKGSKRIVRQWELRGRGYNADCFATQPAQCAS
jgi:hypothetical protein